MKAPCDARDVTHSLQLLPRSYTPTIPFANEDGPEGSWEAPGKAGDAPPEVWFLEGLVDDLALFLAFAGFFLQREICTVLDVSAGKWSMTSLLRLAELGLDVWSLGAERVGLFLR